ncbi:ArsR/SmtB family transcription factor [Halolamina salifodinae]
MERDPITSEAPTLQDVLDALDDPDCRSMLKRLDTPMAAKELSEACEIPQSTTYRKLDLLSEAALVEERTEIRRDGRHTTRYVANFDEIRLSLTDEQSLDISISREQSAPEQRLSELWSEVRSET